MSGSITRRGKSSYRIKFDVPGASKRDTRYVTVHGSRRDAERERAKLITSVHEGHAG